MNPRQEVSRIVLSMAISCAIGAGVLGVVFLATERYRAAEEKRTERRDIVELLDLAEDARITQVRQFLAPERGEVIYRIGPLGAESGEREVVFTLEGVRVRGGESPPVTAGVGSATPPTATAERGLQTLGRTFVAHRSGAPAGYVVEGTSRGYKNRVRFLVALRPDFRIAGVRVVEHEEDPGLGAEIATPQFESQFLDRAPDEPGALEVTRDPMPEDWRAALAEISRMPSGSWRDRFAPLLARERARPIYAVTGATISSRALTEGVRITVERFRHRWQRIAPYLEIGP